MSAGYRFLSGAVPAFSRLAPNANNVFASLDGTAN
jgi:hypothetical protein